MQQYNKAQLQTLAETKTTYAPHNQRERPGDGETEKGRWGDGKKMRKGISEGEKGR